MKTTLLALLFLLFSLAGCATLPSLPNTAVTISHLEAGWNFDVYHDTKRHVTCWVFKSHGVSCLPDSAIREYVP